MARRKKTMAAHPGEILHTDFIKPLGITADVAKYFSMTPQFWMNLQTDYDLSVAAVNAPLNKIKPRVAA